jgi:hypothetical protein
MFAAPPCFSTKRPSSGLALGTLLIFAGDVKMLLIVCIVGVDVRRQVCGVLGVKFGFVA